MIMVTLSGLLAGCRTGSSRSPGTLSNSIGNGLHLDKVLQRGQGQHTTDNITFLKLLWRQQLKCPNMLMIDDCR